MSEVRLTKRSSRVLAIASLALTGCWDGSSSCPNGECNGHSYSYGAGPGEATCVDWYSYDNDWHRRHCSESTWVWCNAPDASSYAASDAASGSGEASSATDEGGSSSATNFDSPADSGEGGPGGDASSGAGWDAGGSSQSIDDSGAATDGSGGVVETEREGGTDAAAGDGPISEGSAACTSDVCICQRDDDCPGTEVCDHTSATCVAPPPACSALTTEAACTGRADCSPVYGGIDCSNDLGTPCVSGEANCTCASYGFAACAIRDL
jgi:hypothetical protein